MPIRWARSVSEQVVPRWVSRESEQGKNQYAVDNTRQAQETGLCWPGILGNPRASPAEMQGKDAGMTFATHKLPNCFTNACRPASDLDSAIARP